MSNPHAARGSDKSMFAQTCRLLRDYIKEKGPLLADFTLSQAALPADQKLSLTQNLSSMDHGDFSIKTNEASQMTIFYGGQVIVLNMPSIKAEQVMRLASKASSSNDPVDSSAAVLHLDSTGRPSTHTSSGNDASRFQATHQPIVTADLPIKRKASLSLFLEKRKNRINARAPYNIKGEDPSKSVDKKPWLELASPSPNYS